MVWCTIDAVILPPSTVVDVAVEFSGAPTLVAAVSAAGLLPTLQGDGPLPSLHLPMLPLPLYLQEQ